MIEWFIWLILGLALIVAIPLLFFYIGLAERKVLFFTLLNVDLIPFALLVFLSVFSIIANIWSLLSSYAFVVVLVYLANRVVRSIAMYDAASNDKLAWVYVIFYLPVFGWIIYYATK